MTPPKNKWVWRDHVAESASSWTQAIGASCFDTYSSEVANTFDFAHTDGVTPEVANIIPKHMHTLVPTEELYNWVAEKQRQNANDLLQRNCQHTARVANATYKPIADPHEIRVIEIHPGTFSDSLKRTLHHCSVEFEHFIDHSFPPRTDVNKRETRHALSCTDLNQPVWYTALSYTWGKPNPETDTLIECDQSKLTITQSLDIALR